MKMHTKNRKPSNGISKRVDIQGLRAWAILLVLLYHFFPKSFPNGYIGVDMFLVVSGYLIAMILGNFETLDLAAFRTFYYRRMKRIIPLYFFVIALVLSSMYIVLPDAFYDINIESAQRAIFLITNMKFSLDPAKAYEKMLANAEDMFTHTWSLCVEIQWYCIVPQLFFIQRQFRLPAMHFFIVIGSFSLLFYLQANSTIAFNCMLARVWQFCCGITAYLITKSDKSDPIEKETVSLLEEMEDETELERIIDNDKRILPYIAYFLFGLILYSFSWLRADATHLRIEITFLSTILIVIGHYHQIWILSNSLLCFIGDISYSLYLVHWPIYVMVKHHYMTNIYALLSGAGLCFLVAILVYYGYERPYLRLSPTSILLLTAALCGWFTVMINPQLFTSRIDYESKYNLYGVNLTFGDPSKNLSVAIAMNYVEGIADNIGPITIHDCTKIKLESNISYPGPYGFYKMNGDHPGKLKFLIIGNSYAGNAANLIYDEFNQFSNEFFAFYQVGCEPLVPLESQNPGCVYINDFREIFNIVQPDVLFIVNRAFYIKEPMINKSLPIEEDIVYQRHLNYLNWYKQNEKLKKIYILQSMPACVARCASKMNEYMYWNHKSLVTARDRFIIWDEKIGRIRYEKLVESCQKCELFDYMPYLIDKNGNFTVYDEEMNLAYLDNDIHLTKFGKAEVKKMFKKLAQSFGKQFGSIL